MIADALRVAIVDDERAARDDLRRALAELPDLDVVGEAADLAAARCLLHQTQPQLLLLDVELLDGSGFDLLGGASGVQIVFVTAHAAHAVRAFERDACDYLLKPVQETRLRQAVERARRRALPAIDAVALDYDAVLMLRSGERNALVAVADIAAVVADGDCTWLLCADGRRVRSARPMRHWERRLPAKQFARIHRASIVNLRRVRSIDPGLGQSQRVHIEGCSQTLILSRRHALALGERLGG